MKDKDKKQTQKQEPKQVTGCIVDTNSETYKYLVQREEEMVKAYGLDRKVDENN